MKISLTPTLEKFVTSSVASGRYASVTEVIQESLRFLEEYEALQETPTEVLQKQIAVGLEQAERGELTDGEEVFKELDAQLDSAAGPA